MGLPQKSHFSRTAGAGGSTALRNLEISEGDNPDIAIKR
jgi:hypothetical protein